MHQETAENRPRPSSVNSARPLQAPCRPSRVKSCPSRVKRPEVVHRPSTSIVVSGEAAAHHRHLWRCSRTWPASPVLTMPDPQRLPPADQAGEGSRFSRPRKFPGRPSSVKKNGSRSPRVICSIWKPYRSQYTRSSLIQTPLTKPLFCNSVHESLACSRHFFASATSDAHICLKVSNAKGKGSL